LVIDGGFGASKDQLFHYPQGSPAGGILDILVDPEQRWDVYLCKKNEEIRPKNVDVYADSSIKKFFDGLTL
jgi:hypothetical protein